MQQFEIFFGNRPSPTGWLYSPHVNVEQAHTQFLCHLQSMCTGMSHYHARASFLPPRPDLQSPHEKAAAGLRSATGLLTLPHDSWSSRLRGKGIERMTASHLDLAKRRAERVVLFCLDGTSATLGAPLVGPKADL